MSVVVLALTAALTGCQTQHVIEWPGVQVTAYTLPAGKRGNVERAYNWYSSKTEKVKAPQ